MVGTHHQTSTSNWLAQRGSKVDPKYQQDISPVGLIFFFDSTNFHDITLQVSKNFQPQVIWKSCQVRCQTFDRWSDHETGSPTNVVFLEFPCDDSVLFHGSEGAKTTWDVDKNQRTMSF